MDFKTFYQRLTIDKRQEFAAKVGTTVGYCHQIAHGKRIELGLADTIVANSDGALTLASLNLTERAEFHRQARITPDAINSVAVGA